jgi:hypothetical protein
VKSREYIIKGNYGEYGEIYHSKKSAKKDLKWARKQFPKDNFRIYSRKVGEWKEVS